MKFLSAGIVGASLGIFTILLGGQPARAEVIRVNGTGCGIVMMKPLIAAYQKANRGVTIEMQKSLGSSAAIKAVGKNAIDLAVTSRPPKPKEAAEGVVGAEYGKTPFALVTNRSVKAENLSMKQVPAMYGGQIAKWPGGDFVRVVLRPNDDSDTKILRAISADMDRALTAAHARSDMLLGITDQDGFELLKKTQGALGFISLTLPISEPDTVNLVKVDGVAPTLANLASHRYPYAKSLYFVTRKNQSPALRKFIEFLHSKKGEAIATKAGVLVNP